MTFCSLVLFVFSIFAYASNLDYSFHETGFNFSLWRQSSNGFSCSRNDQYLILCQNRWDSIIRELDVCKDNANGQCAKGSNAMLTTIIAVQAICIGVLLMYTYKKPRIAEREMAETQKWILNISETPKEKNKLKSKTDKNPVQNCILIE